MSFQIIPAMYEEPVMDLLSSLAEKRITTTRFFQLLNLALEKEECDEDHWLDLVDILLDKGIVGLQEIQATLLEHNPNATCRSFLP